MVCRFIPLIGTPKTMTTPIQVNNILDEGIPATKKARRSNKEPQGGRKGQTAKLHALFNVPLEIVFRVRPFTSLFIRRPYP